MHTDDRITKPSISAHTFQGNDFYENRWLSPCRPVLKVLSPECCQPKGFNHLSVSYKILLRAVGRRQRMSQQRAGVV